MGCFQNDNWRNDFIAYVKDKEVESVMTDKYCNEVLNSNIFKYFQDNNPTLFQDYTTLAYKSLLAGYKEKLKESTDKSIKKTIPEEIEKKLDNDLLQADIVEFDTNKWLKTLRDNIVEEKVVSEDTLQTESIDNLKLADLSIDVDTQLMQQSSKNKRRLRWQDWIKDNPHGIVAYRTSRKNEEFADPKYALRTRSMGNPFMGWLKDGVRGRDSILFENWLKTGDNNGNKLATEELRQAYLKLIEDAKKWDAKVLYWQETEPSKSHATVISKMINPQRVNKLSKKEQKEQERKIAKQDLLSTKKVKDVKITSNFSASEIFDNEINDNIDDIINSDSEVYILYSNNEQEKKDFVEKVDKQSKDKVVYINPSSSSIKKAFALHNKIAIVTGNGTIGKNIDNLYKNVKIDQSAPTVNNGDFFENHDLILFSHKIQHEYNKVFTVGQDKEVTMAQVLRNIRNEYNEMTAEEKDTYKGEMYKSLIDNFDHIKTIITIKEKLDEDEIEDYENTNTEDALWSESHSTSNMPKDDMLLGLLSSFENGKEDELGTPLYYDPMIVNNILTRMITGSKDRNDMIKKISENQRKYKFFPRLLQELENDKSGRLKSILFTKYANLYFANYVTINGNRIIDEGTAFATTSINLGVVNNPIPTLCVFSEDFDQNSTEILAKILTLNSGLEGTDDQNNEQLKQYLLQAGFELQDDEHNLNVLSNDELQEIKTNLGQIYANRAKYGFDDVTDFIDSNKNFYNNILKILNSISEQKTESIIRTKNQSVFVCADKNYIDRMFDGLRKDQKKFIIDEFLKYELFTSNARQSYETASNGCYSSLIKKLALSENDDWFRVSHFFVYKEKDSNPSKYSELTVDELAEINRKIFWKEAGVTGVNKEQFVWVHAPIYADKGSLHFYRVPIVDIESIGTVTYEEGYTEAKEPQIITEIKNLILLETNRISRAKDRWKQIQNGTLEPIDCYDILKGKPGNAHKYCFQPFLNNFKTRKNEKGEEYNVSLYDVLQEAKSNLEKENIIHEAAVQIYRRILFEDVFKHSDKDLTNTFKALIDALQAKDYTLYNETLNAIKGIDKNIQEQRDTLKANGDEYEYEINDEERIIERMQRVMTSYIRQADIQQLTISDPAFYKNEVDVQKRYAQVQAGYQRPDTKSKYGREYMRTIYLKDFNMSLSDEQLLKMKNFLQRAAEQDGVNIDVDAIVSSFSNGNINVADAQCFRCLSSYRSVRDMFGQWTDKDEALYQKIQNGETITADDYSQVWQTLKPFVYTQQESEYKDEKGASHNLKVGYQYKNSENVLFNMYMLFGDNRSALAELNRFMEEYDIDTVQFESAVKVGREGLIDLNNIEPDQIFNYLEEKTGVKTDEIVHETDEIDENGEKKKVKSKGNSHVIHEIPYSEYGIKTSTPPHMYDTEQQLGSQLKKLLQGDIPDNAEIYLDTEGLLSGFDNAAQDEQGKITFKVNGEEIELKEKEEIQPDGTKKTQRYLDKEGYLKLFNGLLSDMILDEYKDVQEIFSDNERLSNALQEMMGTSPKYDYDIKQALKVKDGKWVVDPKNPAIKDKVVLLMSSILKNRINKQLTRGGTAIQMACWRGNIKHDDGTYGPLKIVRDESTGRILYMEALMPAYSKSFIDSMINPDGILDPRKCKDKNLLNALCYRVPTEDIYSMIPLKIVGFTPMQFGTNIMLPQEITTLTGSDFDVDKMYMYFPDFKLRDKWNIDKDKAREFFNKSSVKMMADIEIKRQIDKDNLERKNNGEPELTDDEKKSISDRITDSYFDAYCVERKFKVQRPYFVRFDSNKDISENNTAQKRNLLLSLMRGCISSPHNITKEQNPGGFDYLKKLAGEVNPEVAQPMNLTESQYLNFFNLNMTGKRLIGIYANHNVAHALCQNSGLGLSKPIKIGKHEYKSLSNVKDTNNRRISRNIAEFLAASVDNAKDPVLAKLWQNNYTASTTCFLMRLGVPPKTIVSMYKYLNDTYPKEFKKFMDKGPAAFRRFAMDYNPEKPMAESFTYEYKGADLNSANFFAMLGYYESTIQNLETLNSLLKSDSTNGAMYDVTSIIENILKVNRLKQDSNLEGVDNLIPDFENNKDILKMSKQQIVEEIEKKVGKGNVKSYQTAYYLTWANFRQYFSSIIDDGMIDECINLGMQLPKFNSDNINKFINDYKKQQLRYLDYFKPILVNNQELSEEEQAEIAAKYGIESTERLQTISTNEIMENIKESVPKRLEEFKNKYPDNMFIKMLSRFSTKDGDYLMMKNIADMRAETVNEVKEAFNELFSNPYSNEDAVELIKYALCVNGFGYDPRSFISMIPIKTLSQIEGIQNIFNYFEIDNLDNFENEFIVKNDLVDYSLRLPKELPTVFKTPSKSKIIGTRPYTYTDYKTKLEVRVPGRYFVKLYETEDGAYYTEYKGEVKNPDYKDKIYEILDNEVISLQIGSYTYNQRDYDVDEEKREEAINNLVDNVIREANEQGIDLSNIDKETVMKVLSDDNSLGRFFNLNADPMSVYDPISIQWC